MWEHVKFEIMIGGTQEGELKHSCEDSRILENSFQSTVIRQRSLALKELVA